MLEAKGIFDGLRISVVSSRRLLGGGIGDAEGKRLYVQNLIHGWLSELKRLTMIASSQPQVAYTAFTKSLQNQWAYLQRVVPDSDSIFNELETVILKQFLPTVIGCEVSLTDRLLFSLPARWGGLGVFNPTETAELSYSLSRKATQEITKSIKDGSDFEIDSHLNLVHQICQDGLKFKE